MDLEQTAREFEVIDAAMNEGFDADIDYDAETVRFGFFTDKFNDVIATWQALGDTLGIDLLGWAIEAGEEVDEYQFLTVNLSDLVGEK